MTPATMTTAQLRERILDLADEADALQRGLALPRRQRARGWRLDERRWRAVCRAIGVLRDELHSRR